MQHRCTSLHNAREGREASVNSPNFNSTNRTISLEALLDSTCEDTSCLECSEKVEEYLSQFDGRGRAMIWEFGQLNKLIERHARVEEYPSQPIPEYEYWNGQRPAFSMQFSKYPRSVFPELGIGAHP